MGSLVTKDEKTARRKGVTAAAVGGGSLLFLAGGFSVLGILGLCGAGYLTYDWFIYRAKRGMRF
jgi:hypothetical protein